jgi:hypothetical protein
MRGIAAVVFMVVGMTAPAEASFVSVSGTVTQGSGGAAVANPGLNSIMVGDSYTVMLDFNGDILSPGSYSLTSIFFSDAAAGASESAFISGGLTITQVGASDQFNVLGCLIDAATCVLGNELNLNFQIPAAQLNLFGVTAQPIPSLQPLDLLEESGSTEIQGLLSMYSYTATSETPEPSTMGLLGAALVALGLIRMKKTKTGGM